MAKDKEKGKTKVDPTKIIVKGPTFEYRNTFSEKEIVALKREKEKKGNKEPNKDK